MVRRSFFIEVSIFAEGDTLPASNYVNKVIKWYKTTAYDQLNFTIHHVENEVFKIEYDSETDDNDYDFIEIEQGMIADPDDDGNYPLIINKRYYLVSGKVLSSGTEVQCK